MLSRYVSAKNAWWLGVAARSAQAATSRSISDVAGSMSERHAGRSVAGGKGQPTDSGRSGDFIGRIGRSSPARPLIQRAQFFCAQPRTVGHGWMSVNMLLNCRPTLSSEPS